MGVEKIGEAVGRVAVGWEEGKLGVGLDVGAIVQILGEHWTLSLSQVRLPNTNPLFK